MVFIKFIFQDTPLKELTTFSPKLTPENLNIHSVCNPTFYMREESFSENGKVNEKQDINKRFSDIIANTSVTDKRNKLVRESFI